MKRQLLSVVFVLTVFLSVNAHGAILDVRDGQLFGAFDVDVNGVLYDVQFQDGTCIELYGGCDEYSDFPFTDPSDPDDGTLALVAAQALLDQVFIDSSLGAFDSNPNLTNGLTRPSDGYVHTPLFANLSSEALALITVSHYRNENADAVGQGGGLNRQQDTSTVPWAPNSDRNVYAVWTRATPVPIPPSLLLMFSALVSVLGFRGLRQNRRSRD